MREIPSVLKGYMNRLIINCQDRTPCFHDSSIYGIAAVVPHIRSCIIRNQHIRRFKIQPKLCKKLPEIGIFHVYSLVIIPAESAITVISRFFNRTDHRCCDVHIKNPVINLNPQRPHTPTATRILRTSSSLPVPFSAENGITGQSSGSSRSSRMVCRFPSI